MSKPLLHAANRTDYRLESEVVGMTLKDCPPDLKRSQVPFVILDLRNLRAISIDIEDNSAWAESGATTGELYYAIAESTVHDYPTGTVPGVGIGGHFSGGGVGYLVRKHGLAADNVVDALILAANGQILDKESMGSDLFWAIRGGEEEQVLASYLTGKLSLSVSHPL